MKGYKATYVGLFDHPSDARPAISAIEIPIIQRDFAQGRPDDEATAIRERFLDAVVRAAVTDTEMGLDFVYGDVDAGVMRPLDGQQRLTTLFLLHWYVASRAEALDPSAPWLQFSYATRPTARDFCRALAENPYPGGADQPREWATDQPWYLYPWRQDPTIASMLVMLDALHERFEEREADFTEIWERLQNRESPAIWFLFLPVVDMDHGEDLYIKMNSRGKPLTSFEVFKADLEEMLRPVVQGRPCTACGDHDLHEHLTTSLDGRWADVLWEYEKSSGGDFVVDAEFMRYLAFIIDICEWRDGQPDRRWRDKAAGRERPLEERARLAFVGVGNPHAGRNRDFFFHAFDTWHGVSPHEEFTTLFSANGVGEGPLPLLVSASPDLFGAALATYGGEFSLAETLMLFAVLLSRQGPGIEAGARGRRLRTLRNLAESAFIDRNRMAEYVGTVERLMLGGTLDGAQGFNAEWTADELRKWQLVDSSSPSVVAALNRLEDLMVIRGRLLAFDLDARTIEKRSTAFEQIADPDLRDSLCAALLTKGDYSRDVGWKGTRRQLGSSAKDDSWRDLFTTGSRASVARTREPLMALLDDVHQRMAGAAVEASEALQAICADWLADREAQRHFDWRYYFVRYPGARSSVGEGYFHSESYDASRGGFTYGRIRMLHGGNYSAYFSDALLRAAWVEGHLAPFAREPRWWHRTDPGMGMINSAVEIRCVDEGFELVLPPDDVDTSVRALGALEALDGVVENRVLISQSDWKGVPVDRQDRVQACVRLVQALHGAGL